jgi:transcriptional regulator with XRE-family HTH domain
MVKLSRLRTLRQRKALSQRELAALAGLSHLTIVRLEAGNDSPYPRTVRKLAQALGVEPEALMEPDERP